MEEERKPKDTSIADVNVGSGGWNNWKKNTMVLLGDKIISFVLLIKNQTVQFRHLQYLQTLDYKYCLKMKIFYILQDR